MNMLAPCRAKSCVPSTSCSGATGRRSAERSSGFGGGSRRRRSSSSPRTRPRARMRSPPATPSGSSERAARSWSSSRAWNGGRRTTRTRSASYLADPSPDSVLALIAEGALKHAALVAACEKAGQVLSYDVPKPKDPSVWVRSEFERLGVRADGDASRALVEIVGDDVIELETEIEKIATWAAGEPVGRREVELLAVTSGEMLAWTLTDAWGARDLPGVLGACETLLERRTREPFGIAAALAGYVSRVRVAQAIFEEGLRIGRGRQAAQDQGVPGEEARLLRAQLHARRARCRGRPARRARRGTQGRKPPAGGARARAGARGHDGATRRARPRRSPRAERRRPDAGPVALSAPPI